MSRICIRTAARAFGSMIAVLALAAVFIAAPAAETRAEDRKVYAFDGSFEDAAFELESAIVDRGLVVDYVSQVGDMLSRTKDDVDGAKDLFDTATVYVFCSAVLSRKVMEADPMNIAFCPYSLFVAQQAGGGAVHVGYRTMPDGPMKTIESLLDDIARAATGN
jgi:uncharacterized protein (DUF302 family)